VTGFTPCCSRSVPLAQKRQQGLSDGNLQLLLPIGSPFFERTSVSVTLGSVGGNKGNSGNEGNQGNGNDGNEGRKPSARFVR